MIEIHIVVLLGIIVSSLVAGAAFGISWWRY